MKINESQSTATVVGEIQSNAVSIDLNNIGFITQLLSTNLYSRPIDSFLREIVSNAWDSHVEANNTEPILLEIGTDTENKNYCRIQDFGIGLSPQRFNEIYKNIGSSTKRGDNTQIGGFGIGRFSALAYSGTVYITSNCQGVKYKYLMYKDGNMIKIDELFQDSTDERDGLEVMVYLKSGDFSDFQDAIKNQLIYFENLYLSFDRYYDGDRQKSFADSFNNLKIKRYKNFSVNTFSEEYTTTLCLGKIQYPLNKNAIGGTKFKFDQNYPIALNFEIGDLEVTPNREQILYTKYNIEKIRVKLDAAQDELDEITKTQLIKDYDNFDEYVDVLRNSKSQVILFENSTLSQKIFFNYKVDVEDITYKGKSYPKGIVQFKDYVNQIQPMTSYLSFKVDNSKIYVKNLNTWYNSPGQIAKDLVNYKNYNIKDPIYSKVIICNYSNLNNISKDYLRESALNGTMFFRPINYRTLIKYAIKHVKEEISSKGIYCKFKWDKETFKLIIRPILKMFEEIPIFTNSDVPQAFITKRATTIKANKVTNNTQSINWKEEVNLFILRDADRTCYNNPCPVATTSLRYTLADVKKKYGQQPVIYSVKDDTFLRELYWAFRTVSASDFRRYKFVEIAPTKLRILKQFPNFIKIEDFMIGDYKKIRMIATARLLDKEYPYIKKLFNLGSDVRNVSTQLYETLTILVEYMSENLPRSYYHSYGNEILEEIDKLCKDHNYYDNEILGLLQANIKLLENSRFLLMMVNKDQRLDPHTVNIAVDYALTKKLFVPNHEAVKKLRKETILNIKEKDEIN